MGKWASYTLTDFHAYYIQKNPSGLDYKRFKALLADYYTILADEILSGVVELKLPFRLGILSIVKYRPAGYDCRSLSVDFKATKELGRCVYHLNSHSDGFKYRLHWRKNLRNNNSIGMYQVNLVRANKRMLASIIKNKINDFPEI